MTSFTFATYGSGESPRPWATPTVTVTGVPLPPSALPVASVNSPADIPTSGTAAALKWPGRSLTPVARTVQPSGTVTVRSKSAAGEVVASAKTVVGGSVAHPTPGSHASSG